MSVFYHVDSVLTDELTSIQTVAIEILHPTNIKVFTQNGLSKQAIRGHLSRSIGA